LGWSRNKV